MASGNRPPGDRAVESVVSYFDGQAVVWRDMYLSQGGVYAGIQRERQEWVLRTIRELRLPPGTPVLEVGIGAGGLAVALAREGLRTIGVDLSPAMLELSLQAARTQGMVGSVSVALADACRLPFRDGEFPLVIAIGVIPWVADPRAFVSELSRVTAAFGHVVITADNSRRLTHALDPRLAPWLARPRRLMRALVSGGPRRGTTAHGLARGEFSRMLAESRLEVLHAEPLGFGPFTFLGRQVVPERLGHCLNALLQKGARRGIIGLPETACQHLVLARSGIERGVGEGSAHHCRGPSSVGEVSEAAC